MPLRSVRQIVMFSSCLMPFLIPSRAWTQGGFDLPPVPKSEHAGKNGMALIAVQQPGFAAEIVLSNQSDTDLLNYAQVTNRTKAEITSVQLGWAYLLPGGWDFHAGEIVAPKGGVRAGATFDVDSQNVAPRADAKAVVAFVEQVTYADGTVTNADHAQIKAFYDSCCGGGGVAIATGVPKPKGAKATGPVVRLAPKVSAQGIGVVAVPQPDMPLEVLSVDQTGDDWLKGAQLHDRSRWGFASYRMGWAYVLPTGVEYHEGETVRLEQNIGPNGVQDMVDQHVPARRDAKEFLFFVEEATQGDGTPWKTSHQQIEAEYKLCSSARNAAGEYTPSAADAAQIQASMDALVEPAVATVVPINFDVVSFRRAQQPGSTKLDMPAQGDYIAYHGVSMHWLLLFAYEHKGYFSVSNEPGWVNSIYYEFQAKVAPEDIPVWRNLTLTQKRVMMRGLLAEQVKLRVHDDTSEHPVYDLVVAKDGPKLTAYQPGDTIKLPWGETRSGKVLTWVDPFHLVC